MATLKETKDAGQITALMVACRAKQLAADAGAGVPGARPEWRQSVREFLTNLAIVLVFAALAGPVIFAYQAELVPVLDELRGRYGVDVWPHHWPLAAQIPLAFFLSEAGWYWLHRAEHRFSWIWRATTWGAWRAWGPWRSRSTGCWRNSPRRDAVDKAFKNYNFY